MDKLATNKFCNYGIGYKNTCKDNVYGVFSGLEHKNALNRKDKQNCALLILDYVLKNKAFFFVDNNRQIKFIWASVEYRFRLCYPILFSDLC